MSIVRSIFVGIGIVALSVFCVVSWKQTRPNKYMFEDFESSKIAGELPRYIEYGEVRVPVETAEIVNGAWPESERSALYLLGSGRVGEVGNVVIYGHNWPSLLAFVIRAKPGEVLGIVTDQGRRFEYVVELAADVSPDQTHVLDESADKRLTVYTCSGFLETKRRVVVAKLPG